MYKILSKPPQKGFSLVEVMIAMTISLIIRATALKYTRNQRVEILTFT